MADEGFRHSMVRWSGGSVHVVEAGDPAGPPVLFLHGWPQSAHAWRRVMRMAGACRALAIDLPGVGRSAGAVAGGGKRASAAAVHEVVTALGLRRYTLVGHDIGGMIAFAYVRAYSDELDCAVIMNTVIPGVDPWEKVRRSPYIWHFAFHSVPGLPEVLVHGRQRAYFDYFYDTLSPEPSTITDRARSTYADTYRTPAALAAGFDWYRSFDTDASDNAGPVTVDTRTLYLRGEKEGGDVAAYETGLRGSGLTNVSAEVIANAGHFAPEDTPDEVWRTIRGWRRRW